MLIECDTCRVRACGDCVVTALLQIGGPGRAAGPGPAAAPPPDQVIHLDDGELAALDLLAELGMVPPLRHERAS
ncbi:hypothetical protein SAMN04489712_10184 [Thermomonospora echinospora]|uniref:Uncharacterized protein n=1 Tax=Thermomonospora echinospora TaxID=1992 RepID=A0A1H5S517_9ACTN|nr:hypothetical protein [Thermomonospora echinospora]SEF45709.1 hypothetical protein SAMN04489712_10184 [Thermomonospora echinospora]